MINIGYFIVVVFGSLTIYYIWNDYKQGKMSKNHLQLFALWKQL